MRPISRNLHIALCIFATGRSFPTSLRRGIADFRSGNSFNFASANDPSSASQPNSCLFHQTWLTGARIRGKICTEHEGMDADGQNDRSARCTSFWLSSFSPPRSATDAWLFRWYSLEFPALGRERSHPHQHVSTPQGFWEAPHHSSSPNGFTRSLFGTKLGRLMLRDTAYCQIQNPGSKPVINPSV